MNSKYFNNMGSNALLVCGIVLLSYAFTPFLGSAAFAYPQGTNIQSIETNRARYAPGDSVIFTVTFQPLPDSVHLLIQYRHLGLTIGEHAINVSTLSSIAWTWVPPTEDYRGYMAEVTLTRGTDTLDQATIGLDVSSQWNKFPRYGFVSKYPLMDPKSIEAVIKRLNRFHINGVQFYDWHYKHHMPLKGTPDNPASLWNDIANRTNYFWTVQEYINAAHRFGMQAMAYNLLYGAFSDAENDGVKVNEWGLYRDQAHQQRYMYDLPSGWASDLYFMDPSNQEWKSYLYAQEKKVFQALPFDGWHVDQVGDPGIVYNYKGLRVKDADHFQTFLTDAKNYLNVRLVMNAVNQYGQQGIAKAPVDFVYTEVWEAAQTYEGLKGLVENNWTYSAGELNTIFAAYMNYGLANIRGSYFNTPGVLLTDAVMFASGGAHLELGEHMLVHEYFPNDNVRMTPDLEQQLIHYYDFLVAYQNVLRDSVTTSSVTLTTTGAVSLSPSERQGSIWYFARAKGNYQIIHFINFVSAAHLFWRDNTGTQTMPGTIVSLPISFSSSRTVKKIWLASPDYKQGLALTIPFQQSQGKVSLSVPYLKYWDMLVIEFATGPTSIKDLGFNNNIDRVRSQNYPSPFHSSTTLQFSLPSASSVSLRVYDVLGREISTLVNDRLSMGKHHYVWNAAHLSSGVYLYRLQVVPLDVSRTSPFDEIKRVLLLK